MHYIKLSELEWFLCWFGSCKNSIRNLITKKHLKTYSTEIWNVLTTLSFMLYCFHYNVFCSGRIWFAIEPPVHFCDYMRNSKPFVSWRCLVSKGCLIPITKLLVSSCWVKAGNESRKLYVHLDANNIVWSLLVPKLKSIFTKVSKIFHKRESISLRLIL